MMWPERLSGQTYHGRHGSISNAFRYGVDYLLIDPQSTAGPSLFSRNRRNLIALWDRDHGGPPGEGRGLAWVREVLETEGLGAFGARVLLLAQPRVLGHVFNPVSFWLCFDEEGVLRVVISEVTNTYGDRHSYLCHLPNYGPLTREARVQAKKIFHVSPFQAPEGEYTFRFDIGAERIGIWIDYRNGAEGVLATLTGQRTRLTNRGLLAAALRRPFGSRRVLGLIHWQAFKLWWKGAPWTTRPEPPTQEVSR